MANTINSPPHGSHATDLEALFNSGIDLETADPTTIQKYVAYRCQGYADHNTQDYSLWNAIQIDFGDFKAEHFNTIDGQTWTLLRDYCYMHGFWIDHNFGPGRTRTTIMLKAVEADWHNEWTLD